LPGCSWLVKDAGSLSRALAVVACVLFILAGILVIAGAELGAALAVAGSAVSRALVLLTFNRWFVFAIAINVAIVVVAIT
jgi:hypothetical protein